MTIKLIIPWLVLGHAIFNTLLMVLFFHQGWLGHVIRKERKAGAPVPLAMARRHRQTGPVLATLGIVGFLAGLVLVVIDRGKIVEYPLHLFMGLAIVLSLSAAYLLSRRIKKGDSTYRELHRVCGIIVLCLYAIQSFLGLSIML